MLTYNSHMPAVKLPEYGRHIQDMLQHCLSIEDRDERTRCARSIVDAMCILFPAQGDPRALRRKYWDHLALMSDFALDVDLPFEIERPADADAAPEPVALGSGHANRRVYGCHLELMVREAGAMPEGEERDQLLYLLASHAKKLQLAVTADGVDDAKIFNDLYEMSDGAVRLDPEKVRLPQYSMASVPGKKKKKK